jgi:Sec-independent protein secretion pathway component TatC
MWNELLTECGSLVLFWVLLLGLFGLLIFAPLLVGFLVRLAIRQFWRRNWRQHSTGVASR